MKCGYTYGLEKVKKTKQQKKTNLVCNFSWQCAQHGH